MSRRTFRLIRLATLSLVLSLPVARTAAAQGATFHLMPAVKGYETYSSNGVAISLNGGWVAGNVRSGERSQAFRWSVGTSDVDVLPPLLPSLDVTATDMDNGGKNITGFAGAGNGVRALYWHSRELKEIRIGTQSRAVGITLDGNTIAGWYIGSPQFPGGGFTYADGQFQQFHRNNQPTRFIGISPNGRFAVGTAGAEKVRWDFVNKQEARLLDASVLTGVADKGNVVGYGTGSPEVPLRWDSLIPAEIPMIPGGRRGGHALAVNQSGDVVVGQGIGPTRIEAFIWSKAAGTISLKVLLNKLGANIPDNVTLVSANAIREWNGLYQVTGQASSDMHFRAFAATIGKAKLRRALGLRR